MTCLVSCYGSVSHNLPKVLNFQMSKVMTLLVCWEKRLPHYSSIWSFTLKGNDDNEFK